MKGKRTVGLVIFAVLIIFGSLFQLPANSADIQFLMQPLPKTLILVYIFITKAFLILGVISGIGIILLKGIFRKTVLFLSFFNIFTYFISLPVVYRNIPNYISQQMVGIISTAKYIPESFVYSFLLTLVILGQIIDIVFAICVIYYFTRPRIKSLFE